MYTLNEFYLQNREGERQRQRGRETEREEIFYGFFWLWAVKKGLRVTQCVFAVAGYCICVFLTIFSLLCAYTSTLREYAWSRVYRLLNLGISWTCIHVRVLISTSATATVTPLPSQSHLLFYFETFQFLFHFLSYFEAVSEWILICHHLNVYIEDAFAPLFYINLV